MSELDDSGTGGATNELEAELLALIDAAPFLAWLADVEGALTYANVHFRALTGADLAAHRGDGWRGFVHPDDHATAVASRARAVAEKAPFQIEYRLRRADGVYRWVRDHGSPRRGPDGALRGFVGACVEIGAERDLQILSRAIEQSPSPVIITSPSEDIEYVNRAFVDITGYAAEEALGRTPRFLKSGATPPETYAEMRAALRAGQTWRGLFCNRRKSGDVYWERAVISPVYDAEGALQHYVAVKEDITERRRLGEQLRQAQRIEAVGQLAGGVAHDFNNILTAQLMNLTVLREREELPQDVRELFGELETGARMAADLTRQLLAFSRRQVLKVEPVDLAALVANVMKMLRRVLREDIALYCTPASTPVFARVDVAMAEQTLMNLVVNARDAMPDGGELWIETELVELTSDDLRQHSEAREGRFARLTVRDTGAGIEEAALPHIFEPFFTTKEKGKGTGLGLATVYGIVKQHGGWIDVETAAGRGTAFHIYYPAAAPERVATAETAPSQPRAGSESILVVEDEAPVRSVMARALTRLGYRVLQAENGPDALRVFAEHGAEVKVLVTDVVMPGGMSGIELARRLSRERPDLSIVVCSGYNADFHGEARTGDFPHTYLPKPFDVSTLVAAVRKGLGR